MSSTVYYLLKLKFVLLSIYFYVVLRVDKVEPVEQLTAVKFRISFLFSPALLVA